MDLKELKQQIFDQVAKHLLAQKARARVSCGGGVFSCQFRAGELACAVGCLIPDELYTRELEKFPVTSRLVWGTFNPEWHDLLEQEYQALQECSPRERGSNTFGFLYDLQWLHDKTMPDLWPRRLGELAEEHGLGTEVLD